MMIAAQSSLFEIVATVIVNSCNDNTLTIIITIVIIITPVLFLTANYYGIILGEANGSFKRVGRV